MSTDLIFEEPPATKRRGGRPVGQSPVGRWLSSLRDHPGQWVKYPEKVYAGTGTKIRCGSHYGVSAGEFETRTVDACGQPGWLYARYVGGES